MASDHSDLELIERIEDLPRTGNLAPGTRAHGVIEQIIHHGFAALSNEQRSIYETVILPELPPTAVSNSDKSTG